MSSTRILRGSMHRPGVVLWWHLHQPDYREPGGRRAWFPWVRMHSLRAYTDLVVHAREHGPAGMTLNIVPSLADQLVDLAEGRVEDRHHRLARHVADGDDAVRQEAFRAHAMGAPRPLVRLEAFERLQGLAKVGHEASLQETYDACVLFHLSWMGFTAGARPEVRALFQRGSGFGADDVRYVLALSREMASGVLPRLKDAASEGSVHLTTTPYMHPILPLLIDTSSAHEATSDGGAPPPFQRRDDAERQVRLALDRHQELFGHRPAAMWPAEGSLSEASAEVLAAAGVKVAASDEELLRKSLEKDDRDAHLHGWRHQRTGLGLLFRDRGLSDDWGFVYRDLDPDEAALAFVGGARDRSERGDIVPVILDGENPFEHYPDAGKAHLEAVSRAARGQLEMLSPEEALARSQKPLRRLATGSWIYARLDIWAGDDEDRQAWALLKAVREAIDLDALTGEARLRAETHLFAAEGSDWFWWYGPEFSTPDKPGFDALFRRHLEEACRAAGLDPAEVAPLDRPLFSRESMGHDRRPMPVGAPPSTEAALDAWVNALRLGGDSDRGSMHRGAPLIAGAQVLTSLHELYVRVAVRDDVDTVEIRLDGPHPRVDRFTGADLKRIGGATTPYAVRWDVLGVAPLATVGLQVVARAGSLQEAAPGDEPLSLTRPPSTWLEA